MASTRRARAAGGGAGGRRGAHRKRQTLGKKKAEMIKNGKRQQLFCVMSFALSQYTGQNTTFGPCIRNMW